MDITGVTGKPYKHPQVRRTVPIHTRSRIDLDGGSRVKRSWRDTSVTNIVEGDTVADFGLIESVVEFVNVPDRESFNSEAPAPPPTWRVRFYNVMGDWRDFPGEQRVFAFSKDPLPKD